MRVVRSHLIRDYMSGLIPNNHDRFLVLLNEAVIKNTVRPRPHEEEKITIPRAIKCSPEIEGDTQYGILLFCGIAHVVYGISKNDIIDYIGIDENEFSYKINKFKNNLHRASKMPASFSGSAFDVLSNQDIDLIKIRNKVKLIKNYVEYYAPKHGILFTAKTRNV